MSGLGVQDSRGAQIRSELINDGFSFLHFLHLRDNVIIT
jgi:hypothetical protein